MLNINIYKGKINLSARAAKYGTLHDALTLEVQSESELKAGLESFYAELCDVCDTAIEVYATIFRRQQGGLLYRWLVIFDGKEWQVEEAVYGRQVTQSATA